MVIIFRNSLEPIKSVLGSRYLYYCHLNINLLRNKFEIMKNIIEDTCDIFLISVTKNDNSFPNSQF